MVRYFLLASMFALCLFLCIVVASEQDDNNDEGGDINLIRRVRRPQHHPSELLKIDEKVTSSRQFASDRQSDISAKIFSQKLDNFNKTNTITWNQRYFKNGDYFNEVGKDGPVFLLIGGERAISVRGIQGGIWIEWAVKYKALCFYVEHRYYGLSHPTPDVSTSNLKYLTSRQALADLAEFIKFQNVQETLTNKKNKWIVFGGSYAGSLAAWMRLKYPELVYGAVASSATINHKSNLPEYYERVRESLKTSHIHGQKCTEAIEDASKTVFFNIMSGERYIDHITELFQVFPKLDKSNSLQVAFFFRTLANTVAESVQNNHNPSWNGQNIDNICDVMTNNSRPIEERLAAISNRRLNLMNIAKLFTNYDTYTQVFMKRVAWNSVLVTNGDRQYTYQRCTELGGMTSSSSDKELFGPFFNFQFLLRLNCIDVFGPTFSDLKMHRGVVRNSKQYGGKNLVVSRTVFSVGTLDPWYDTQMTSNTTGNIVIKIEGASHCQDMYQSNPNDSENLKKAKIDIESCVKKWIEENN